MKTTDSVMRELREKYEIDLSNCGLNADNVDYDKLAEARDNFDKELSHSLAEARREWVEEMRKDLQISKEILGEGGTVGILSSQRLRAFIDTQEKLNSYFDLLTGDNPERKV